MINLVVLMRDSLLCGRTGIGGGTNDRGGGGGAGVSVSGLLPGIDNVSGGRGGGGGGAGLDDE